MYSETCVIRPLLPDKSGLIWQVVFQNRRSLMQVSLYFDITLCPVWKDHLPYKTSFSQKTGWPYKAGRSVWDCVSIHKYLLYKNVLYLKNVMF